MLKRNAHFEEMRRIGREFEEKRRAHEEKKQEIRDTFGWDSEEMKAWYDVKNNMECPLTQGAWKAYRAWKQTIEKEENELFMDDFLWDYEITDFVDTLRKAGIETFIYTNTSTAVMENIHGFEAEGCKLEGLTKIKRTELRFGGDYEIEVKQTGTAP